MGGTEYAVLEVVDAGKGDRRGGAPGGGAVFLVDAAAAFADFVPCRGSGNGAGGSRSEPPRPLSALGERVHIRTNGVRLTGKQGTANASRGEYSRGNRGLQTTLSKASLRRLRDLLCGVAIPTGSAVYSVSWTVPGKIVSVEEWRTLWQRMRKRLTRAGVDLVWRVELQRRKQPHVHAIAWCRDELRGEPGRGGATDGWEVMENGWKAVMKKSGHWVSGADKHSVTIKRQDGLGSTVNWYRYLCGHLQKGKVEQLGWVGRQWGRVGAVRSESGEDMGLTPGAYYRVRRVFRRMMRMRRGLRSLYGKTDVICNVDDARRVVEWAREVPF